MHTIVDDTWLRRPKGFRLGSQIHIVLMQSLGLVIWLWQKPAGMLRVLHRHLDNRGDNNDCCYTCVQAYKPAMQSNTLHSAQHCRPTSLDTVGTVGSCKDVYSHHSSLGALQVGLCLQGVLLLCNRTCCLPAKHWLHKGCCLTGAPSRGLFGGSEAVMPTSTSSSGHVAHSGGLGQYLLALRSIDRAGSACGPDCLLASLDLW